jgi:5-methylcytosine-specific restriction endonuclease McrA
MRLLWWLVRLAWRVAGRLCYGLLAAVGAVLWLLAWPFRRRPEVAIGWPAADAFYRSYRWRRLRIDALEGNRERYGALTCECCLTTRTGQWHVDHVRPRAHHPELALEPGNLQVLCADCNLGKGTRYTTDWRAAETARAALSAAGSALTAASAPCRPSD